MIKQQLNGQSVMHKDELVLVNLLISGPNNDVYECNVNNVEL